LTLLVGRQEGHPACKKVPDKRPLTGVCVCVKTMQYFNNNSCIPVELSQQRGTEVSPVHQQSYDFDSTSQYLAQAGYNKHCKDAFYPDPSNMGWLGSRVVSELDSGAEGPRFKSQPQRCRVTVLGKLFTPILPVHQAAKLVAALLKVAGVTAGLAESKGSVPPGL